MVRRNPVDLEIDRMSGETCGVDVGQMAGLGWLSFGAIMGF